MPGLFNKEQRNSFTKIDDHDRDNDGSWIPYGKTWWLEGKHEGNVIHRIEQKEPDNYTKYLKFLIGLRNKNYDVRDEDMIFYKSDPFIIKSFESWVTKKDLIKASKLCDYDENYLNNLKNQTEEEKEMFAWHMGLSMDELKKIMEKFN